MLVGSHRRAGTPLGAGSHRKGFSDPYLLKATRRQKDSVSQNSFLRLSPHYYRLRLYIVLVPALKRTSRAKHDSVCHLVQHTDT